MREKIIVTLIALIVLASAACFAKMNEPKHPSDYHIGIKYEEALKSDKPALAVFYVDWCGYCMRFMPKFNILSKIYGSKYNFVMINVEASEFNTKLAKDYNLGGYPTVYIIDNKYNNRVLMPNTIYQDFSKFRTELDRYLKIRELLDKK